MSRHFLSAHLTTHSSYSDVVQYQTGFTHFSAQHVSCVSYFVSWLCGEEDIWEKRLWSNGAIESDDTSQERPENHQNVDIPAGTLYTVVINHKGTLIKVPLCIHCMCTASIAVNMF